MDLRAVQDKVIVLPEFGADVSESGIFVGEGELKNQANVIAVGPGVRNKNGKLIPTTVKVGDRVMFDMGCGHQGTIGGKRVLILAEHQIIAIVS